MTGLKMEITTIGVFSTNAAGKITEMSQTADSTCPCANRVTAHSWPASSASECISL
jgi:hypothetical protein